MAYVTITKDLTEVKDKVAFGLTKRQIVCFSLGGIAGVGTYFLTRHSLGNDLRVPLRLGRFFSKHQLRLQRICLLRLHAQRRPQPAPHHRPGHL